MLGASMSCGSKAKTLLADRRRLQLRWLTHRIQRSAGKKPGARFTLFPGVSINRSKNTLRKRDVDPCGLISQLTGVDIDDGPRPAAIVTLLLQQFNGCWCRKRLSAIEKPFQVKQNGLPRIGQCFIQSIDVAP